MFQKSCVRIPAPYTGLTFFTFICRKNSNVCLKRQVMLVEYVNWIFFAQIVLCKFSTFDGKNSFQIHKFKMPPNPSINQDKTSNKKSSAPTILRPRPPGFESQAHHLHFFNVYCWNCIWYWNEKRTKVNKKRPWLAHILNKESKLGCAL